MENGCWEWQGFINRDGYGMFGVTTNGRQVNQSAHLVLWSRVYGEPPRGYVLDHICHRPAECAGGPTCPHRRCVNPQHLELVTYQVNTLRGCGPAAVQAAQTHCPRNHPYDITYRNGRRGCLTCKREWERLYMRWRRSAA